MPKEEIERNILVFQFLRNHLNLAARNLVQSYLMNGFLYEKLFLETLFHCLKFLSDCGIVLFMASSGIDLAFDCSQLTTEVMLQLERRCYYAVSAFCTTMPQDS